MKSSVFTALAAAAILTVCACSSQNGPKSGSSTALPVPAGATNGEMIFQNGKDDAGTQITAAKAALRPSCAACHNANGSGGLKLPGGAVSADLRHNALVTKQKHPYTIALLERAIAMGVDNEGKKLDPVMPHWTLSKGDLHDVAAYVATLK